MKTTLLILPLIACALPVLAQDAQRRPGGRTTGPLMKAIDRNGDGSLQQTEIDMAVASLRALDANKDGTVSPQELGAPPAGEPSSRPSGEGRPGMDDRPNPPGPGGQRRGFDLSRLDTDGDGKISKSEAPERMKERFDMIDTNGDGFLDKAEQDQLIQRLRERAQQGGQQRRPGMGRGGEDTSGGEKPKRPAPIE